VNGRRIRKARGWAASFLVGACVWAAVVITVYLLVAT
jgi:hypothetical protein